MVWPSQGSGEEELQKDRGNDGRGGSGLGEEKDVRAIGETGRRRRGREQEAGRHRISGQGSFVSPGTTKDPGQ